MAKRRPKAKRSNDDRPLAITTNPVPEIAVTRPSGLSTSLSGRQNRVLICALLGLVVTMVFLPVLGNGFVQWDDDITVYRNPHIRGLDIQQLHWMFTDVGYTMRYKPLSWLSIGILYAVSGLKPFAYHLLSLFFHCANTVLVFLVFRKVMEMRKSAELDSPFLLSVIAAAGALIWALHPLRVEPVARVTDMTYCQSTFFVLTSLWCYLQAVQAEAIKRACNKWCWFSVVAFAFAMGSYPFVFAYPIVLLVFDLYLLGRVDASKAWWRQPRAKQILLEKVPFFLLSGILLVTLYGRLTPSGIWKVQALPSEFDWFAKTMQAFYIWGYFVWKQIVPFDLSPVYSTLVRFNPRDWLFVTSAFFVIGLTGLLFWKRRQWPLAWAIWICHLVLLIPALGLTEVPHYAADRYSYVTGILWAALLVGGLLKVCSRTRMCGLALTVVFLLTATLGTMSARQTHIWHDTVTLFEYMIAKLGDDPYRGDILGRLGDYYFEQGKLDEAIVQYQKTLPFMPGSPKLHNSLGVLLMKRGRLDEALPEFKEAVRLDPQAAGLRRNLGEVLSRQERIEEAIVELQEAIRLRPNDSEAHNSLGLLLMKQGELDSAIDHFREALKLQPNNAQARSNLDAALRAKGTTPGL